MATEPRGLLKKQSSRSRQRVMAGDKLVTESLDGTTTTEVLQLGMVAQKVTIQSTGSLAGDMLVSANGTDFVSAGSFTALTPLSYSAHLCVAVKIVRTAGTGKASVLAV